MELILAESRLAQDRLEQSPAQVAGMDRNGREAVGRGVIEHQVRAVLIHRLKARTLEGGDRLLGIDLWQTRAHAGRTTLTRTLLIIAAGRWDSRGDGLAEFSEPLDVAGDRLTRPLDALFDGCRHG